MKSFQQFQEAASTSTSDTMAAIDPKGNSSADGPDNEFNRFKKRPKTGIGGALKDKAKATAGAIKDRMGRPRPDKPGKPVDGRYRIANKTATPKPEKGGALAKRPEEKKSMVQQKTAAAKQPPQHKQLAARPASTAMAGSRQKPAIRPAPERKALPAGQGKPLQSGPVRQKIVAQPARKALPAGRG